MKELTFHVSEETYEALKEMPSGLLIDQAYEMYPFLKDLLNSVCIGRERAGTAKGNKSLSLFLEAKWLIADCEHYGITVKEHLTTLPTRHFYHMIIKNYQKDQHLYYGVPIEI